MSDIFINYANEDGGRAKVLAESLLDCEQSASALVWDVPSTPPPAKHDILPTYSLASVKKPPT